MNQIPRPFPQSYWVRPGQFLAGEYPRNKDDASSQAKIDALLTSGVSAFVDLTDPRDGMKPYRHLIANTVYANFPIRDLSVPATPAQTVAVLDTIDRLRAEGRTVYVHCWGGVGRTGVIVGCWLARHECAGEAALQRLHALWQASSKAATRRSPETYAQEQYIIQWPAGQ